MNQQELRFFKALILNGDLPQPRLKYLFDLYKLSLIPLLEKIEKEIATKQKVNNRLRNKTN